MSPLIAKSFGMLFSIAQSSFPEALATELSRGRTVLVTLTVILLVLLLSSLAPHEKKQVKTAIFLFSFYVLSVFLATVLQWAKFDKTADNTRLIGTILVGISLINLTTLTFFDGLIPRVRLALPRILRDIIILISYAVAGLWLLQSRGFNITTILTTSAILTAVIGLSLQDTLGNLMSGLALQMEHIIQIGDWIKIDQYVGRVKEIRWRQTSIETRNWETVVIPNAQLMKGQVMIYGRRENCPLQTRRWIYFNIDFRYTPTEVIHCVDDALRAAPIENVAAEPQINTVLMDFKESYCQYAVRYWLTNLVVDDPTDSIVRTRIYYALKRAGIPLSIVAQRHFITRVTAKREVRKHEHEIDNRIESLRRIELFHTMTIEELHGLAERLRYAPFTQGETLTRQGAEAHWLYILTSGRVSVRAALNGIADKEVAQLGAGDFFGEMSLMTGAPRSATVIALENVECYRLDKDAFQDVLSARPEIAEDISHALANRRVKLEEALNNLDEESHRTRVEETSIHILKMIRSFFRL